MEWRLRGYCGLGFQTQRTASLMMLACSAAAMETMLCVDYEVIENEVYREKQVFSFFLSDFNYWKLIHHLIVKLKLRFVSIIL